MAGWSRRELMAATVATAAAGCARPAPPEAAPSAGLDLAAAERLAGVTYTEAERRQVVESMEEQLAQIQARRTFAPPFDLPPATVFDPRLPGRTYGPPADRVVAADVDVPVPDDDLELAYAPVVHLARWLRTREVTSVRLAEIALARLERLDPVLHHVVTRVDALEQARAADAELDAGRWRGPLHGVPWGVKDLFDTAGIRTTWGAEPYRDRVPDRDAAVVRRLGEAGAVLVAKLTTGALAYGDIWYGGKTKNPWNLDEGSSGSSAGSAAAVASGCVPFAIGTETLGSIISPSMRTGVTGLRPTFGRVARTGAMPLCWSLDKVGPLVRHVEDAGLVLAAIQGREAEDPSSLDVPLEWDPRAGVEGLRVGLDPAWFDDAGPAELHARDTLADLGVELVEVAVPELPYDALFLILVAEAAAAHEGLTLQDLDDQLAWQDDEAWPNTFRLGRFIPAVDLVQADRLRREVMRRFDGLFGVDALVSPSFAGPLLLATNFTGHPSLTLRVGFQEVPTRVWPPSEAVDPPDPTPHRVPQGLTLWGRLFDEGTLGRLGHALEIALGVATERPPI